MIYRCTSVQITQYSAPVTLGSLRREPQLEGLDEGLG